MFRAHCYIAGLCIVSAFYFYIPVILRLSILFFPSVLFSSRTATRRIPELLIILYVRWGQVWNLVRTLFPPILMAFRSQTRYSVLVRQSP